MSKPTQILYAVLVATPLCLQIFTNASAQTVDASVVIRSGSQAAVSGRFLSTDGLRNPGNFSFERTGAGSGELASRVSNLQLFDASAQPLKFQKLIDGEFVAEGGIVGWQYDIYLAAKKDRSAPAHSSWVAGERGILMAADLLPLNARSGTLRFSVPDGWQVYQAGDARDTDLRDTIVAIGTGWELNSDTASSVTLLLNGKWHFTSTEATDMAREIYSSHRDLFKFDVGGGRILVSSFPVTTPPGNWEAETRGRTITIISSDMPFRTQSLQRLHEQLRHEMFHLWIPNGVNLIGNYDWFYEGFALYQSLKLAVGLNRIRFEDFLDTLSRAHTIDGAGPQRMSLIQASAARFSGANTQVYARGMLVAFLCDLALLQRSKGKRSVENLLRELFAKHRKPNAAEDGNTAVLASLKANTVLVPVVDRYVTAAGKMDWTAELAAAGIEDSDAGPITTLRVKDKLGGRQKTMLDKLGYNNWRRLSPKSK